MNFQKTDWRGFECIELEFLGLGAKLVKPNVAPNGKWALKTEYFDAFPETEIELLRRGYHIAYNENRNRWAEDYDLHRKGEFIKFVSETFRLDKRCVLIGMSCGGLYAVKLAALYPELVRGMYLDAPVMNLLSCPCALGKSEVSLYDEYYSVTGRTVSEMLSYRDSPIDKMHILLENEIPIVLVAGGSDEVVPYSENGQNLEKYYKENGGEISVFIDSARKHHPHGHSDVKLICNIIDTF